MSYRYHGYTYGYNPRMTEFYKTCALCGTQKGWIETRGNYNFCSKCLKKFEDKEVREKKVKNSFNTKKYFEKKLKEGRVELSRYWELRLSGVKFKQNPYGQGIVVVRCPQLTDADVDYLKKCKKCVGVVE